MMTAGSRAVGSGQSLDGFTAVSREAGATLAPASEDHVEVSAAALRRLLEAADLLAEHWMQVAETTPTIVGADTVAELVAIDLVDGDTLEVTAAFRAALQEASEVLFAGASDSPPGGRPDALALPAAGTFGD